MPSVRDVQSAFATSISAIADSQPVKADGSFSDRLRASALKKGWKQADLARAAKVPTARVNDYWNGPKQATANYLFALAEALGVSAEWLALGRSPSLFLASDVDWVALPRYALSGFSPDGKPEPEGSVPLPKHWLKSVSAGTEKLWVTTVPGNVGDWLSEGEEIVCADLEGSIVDGRIYIFMIDGRTIIRRVFATSEGYQLVTGESMTPPLTVHGDFAEQGPFPVARVVGKFRFNPM